MPPPRARGHGGAADEEPENEDPTVKAAKIQAAGQTKVALVQAGAMFAGFFVLGIAMFAGFSVVADALRGVPAGFTEKLSALLKSLPTSLLENGPMFAAGLFTLLAFANAAPMVAAAFGVVATVGASPPFFYFGVGMDPDPEVDRPRECEFWAGFGGPIMVSGAVWSDFSSVRTSSGWLFSISVAGTSGGPEGPEAHADSISPSTAQTTEVTALRMRGSGAPWASPRCLFTFGAGWRRSGGTRAWRTWRRS
mgnify:CR=1 FL=1